MLEFATAWTNFGLPIAAFFPARWLIIQQIAAVMRETSPEEVDETEPEGDAGGKTKAGRAPDFTEFDVDRSLEGAIASREIFVERAMALFRFSFYAEVVAGLGYVALPSVLGWLGGFQDLGFLQFFAIPFLVFWSLLAASRYGVYRGQFRADKPTFGVHGAVRHFVLAYLVGPRAQFSFSMSGIALFTGLGLGFVVASGYRGLGLGFLLAAALHGFLLLQLLRRAEGTPGARLLLLRVFGVDANARFTFGRVLAFWRHFGTYFTVADPSLWRFLSPWSAGLLVAIVVGGQIPFVISQAPFVISQAISRLGLTWLPAAATPAGLEGAQDGGLLVARHVAVFLTAAASVLWLRRRVSNQAVRSGDQVGDRLRRLEERPRNVDLTFKSLVCVCHENTWKPAVAQLVEAANVVLMDLRGFSREREGCEYEVDYLFDSVPIDRIIFLVEAGGDHAAVHQLILERWEHLHEGSPNLGVEEPRVVLYVSRAQNERDVQGILDLLLRTAARSTREGPQCDRWSFLEAIALRLVVPIVWGSAGALLSNTAAAYLALSPLTNEEWIAGFVGWFIAGAIAGPLRR